LIVLATVIVGGFVLLVALLHLSSRVVSAGAFARLGVPSAKVVSDLVWLKSYEWQEQQATDGDVWNAELDQAALTQAEDFDNNGDPERAFQLWSELAENGSIWAMVCVAACYNQGTGVGRDSAKAEEWYERAYRGGSQRAMLRYAGFFIKRGDYAGCEAVYNVDAAQDWPPALFWLAYCRLKQSHRRADYMRALPLLERAADDGSPIAQRLISTWMSWGRFGLLQIPRGFKLKLATGPQTLAIVEEAGL
jgi:TPR repeat protein